MIVGGGPAGAVMANRLTNQEDRSALLLEAGPDYGSSAADWPDELLFPEEQPLTSHSWKLTDAGKGIDLPRARVIGGASAVNACYWIRGSATDFDDWESRGNPGWGFEGLLPYFRRAESDPLGGPLHGTDGPVQVWRADDWSVGDLAYVEAAVAAGMTRVADLNGRPDQEPSVGPVPKNIAGGNRLNSSLSYLAPVRGRENLTIRAEALVDRVLFDGEKAVGVVLADGEKIPADMVVLAAGAYFTPGILKRSGYGDERELKALSIPVRQHLSGVGKNLLDHPFSIGTFEALLRPGAVYGEKLQGQAMATSRSEKSDAEIDCHIYNAQYYDDELDRWLIGSAVSMVNARSVGTVALTSTDPGALPRIEHRHFSDESDLERMCDGVETAREVFSSPHITEITEPLAERTWQWKDRAELRQIVKGESQTTNHCSGTAKMGPSSDAQAVVDTSGRVYGADGLVVADSSVFPTCPRGNIHFPVVAVAEKIAASITE